MLFSIRILGSGSAIPTLERQTSGQIVNYNKAYYIIDCGEATQIAMKKYGISPLKVNHIFISHLHGDHYFGIFGLVNTMHLLNRKKELHIYTFSGLQELIELQLAISLSTLEYPIIFHQLDQFESKCIFESKYLQVESIPLKHRIPTCGFLFREKKKPGNIQKKLLKKYAISPAWCKKIKEGADYIHEDGTIIPNNIIMRTHASHRSYAYCSDTAYDERIIPLLKDVNVLYHEASFCNEHQEIAEKKFHSTAKQAASIAQKANVDTLIVGHFSQRYKNSSVLLNEAKQIFPNTIEAFDGLLFDIV
jgi:ribonuclease Z